MMKDVSHFFAVLRDLTGLTALELNEEGYAEIIFDGDISVTLVKIDEGQMELTSPLDRFDRIDADQMRRVLTANYLGVTTGAARIALHPVEGGLVICERIDVSVLDVKATESRILSFVKHVKYWMSDEAMQLIVQSPASEQSYDVGPSDTFMLRV